MKQLAHYLTKWILQEKQRQQGQNHRQSEFQQQPPGKGSYVHPAHNVYASGQVGQRLYIWRAQL